MKEITEEINFKNKNQLKLTESVVDFHVKKRLKVTVSPNWKESFFEVEHFLNSKLNVGQTKMCDRHTNKQTHRQIDKSVRQTDVIQITRKCFTYIFKNSSFLKERKTEKLSS